MTDIKRVIVLMAICALVWAIIPLQGFCSQKTYTDEPCAEIFLKGTAGESDTRPPKIEALSAAVMDMESGRVLFEKDAYTRRPMASTTKIMTALIAIEKGRPDDVVTVSKRAASVWGSTIGLYTGQQITMSELLYGLMLNSGNDAAIAIAEHICGSVEGFVAVMNQKAVELGANNTHFMSPHGLDMEGHYSTAYDLAVITRYALANPVFSKIVKTISIAIRNRGLYNTNEMLGVYPGTDGVKTGYTGKAGRCLVASATRDDRRYISVVLNCPSISSRYNSSTCILDYAFNNYKTYILLKTGEIVKKVPVIKGIRDTVPVVAMDGITLPLRNDEAETLVTRITLPGSLKAPVYEGIEVGTVKFMANNRLIAQSTLKTGSNITRKGFVDYMGDVFRNWTWMMKLDALQYLN